MYERFTDRSRKVALFANREAQRFNHEYIGTEHFLLGLIKEGTGVAVAVLKNLNIDLQELVSEVESLILGGPDQSSMPQMPRAKKVIEFAMEEARNSKHTYVGTEHFLIGLMREQDGVAARALMKLGLTVDKARAQIALLLSQNRPEFAAGRFAPKRPLGPPPDTFQ